MTALPPLSYMSNAARTQGEMKTALDDIVAFMRERFGAGAGWTTVASASTVTLGSQTSRMILITGTTAITSFGTTSPLDNAVFMLRFGGVLTLTNGGNLVNPTAADIITAAGDTALVVWEGSNVWRVIAYNRFSGLSLFSAALGSLAATTSGTTIDFTDIPSWVRRITVMLNAVSTNGTSSVALQIGDAGGVETSSYVGAVFDGAAGATFSSSFADNTASAAIVRHTIYTLTLLDAATNTWMCSFVSGFSNTASGRWGCGTKALSAALDRVRVTTGNGTDTFDAGSINIQYE